MCLKKQIAFVSFITILASAGCKHESTPAPGNTTNPADTTTPGPVDPANPRFKTDIQPIFMANCSGCHNNTIANDGYNFTSYEKITSKKFVPGNPDETKLYDAITDNDEDDRMPKAPNPRLPAEKITLIRNWILNGAPNN